MDKLLMPEAVKSRFATAHEMSPDGAMGQKQT
jgi:hypothetical protein